MLYIYIPYIMSSVFNNIIEVPSAIAIATPLNRVFIDIPMQCPCKVNILFKYLNLFYTYNNTF